MWWSLQARVAVGRGRHDLAGEGRVAGEQRTTPSSPCAIQLIASRSVSLSVFCAGPPSSGRTAHDCPAQCTCPPPSAASRPHLWNRGEAIGWPQSSTGTSRFMRARNCRRSVRHKVATGVNRTTDPRHSTYIFSIFFPSKMSHGDVR